MLIDVLVFLTLDEVPVRHGLRVMTEDAWSGTVITVCYRISALNRAWHVVELDHDGSMVDLPGDKLLTCSADC